MTEYEIERDQYSRLRREAERMRSDSLRELLTAAWVGVARFGKAIYQQGGRVLGRRRRMNLCVPAPHR
jgi:hypothetical protein